MALTISEKGLALIKRFEGFRAAPYQCPAGRWTIGYGSTAGVTPDMAAISRERADILLRHDILPYERAIRRLITVPLTQPQFDALVSFTYNVGEGAFARSTLRKKLNNHDYAGAAQEFHRWTMASGVTLHGLVKRRAAESALFRKPLAQSRTLAASSLGGAAVLGGAAAQDIATQLQALSAQLQPWAVLADVIKWCCVALTIAAFGMIVYARLDDYRQHVR